jgi:hypothetical protein
MQKSFRLWSCKFLTRKKVSTSCANTLRGSNLKKILDVYLIADIMLRYPIELRKLLIIPTSLIVLISRGGSLDLIHSTSILVRLENLSNVNLTSRLSYACQNSPQLRRHRLLLLYKPQETNKIGS